MSDPYNEGFDAFDDDLTMETNPYPSNTVAASEWDEGWDSAACDGDSDDNPY